MKRIFNKHIKNEKGSQAIEFVAMFPLVILAMLIIWQVALIAFSVVVAESAARDGARAAAVHNPDWASVTKKSAKGIKVAVSGGPGAEEARVEVKAKAPVIALPIIADMEFSFTVDAVMPMEEEPDED
ncbi:hypothetical protein EVU96_24380 [Bacillus infantis]|uniref:TadE/TadG family type IV pilus assembly protein n=1 Tax=Bacillus infantis TaxID=324767 RepID=UPI00101D6D57|nr:TadE/TadG family type IV pilus assembly protein [Bacillus infantis]MCK6208642.1 pilus assembly protein [Bacillus infantis]RYI25287.1 hypothetical protein EVU96_24380 [Bacillus infantis]